MTSLRPTSILVAALIAVLPMLAVPPAGAAGAQAPTLNGAYDADTQVLTLTWQPDVSWPAETVYTLYRNGQQVVQTTQNSTTVDLSLWVEGVREYTLTVTLPGMAEGNASLPFTVVKDVMLPSSCQVASISIYTRPPGATYTVYEECLPG